MHESGLIRKLIETARAEAARQGGSLRSISVRLGALAGGTAEHLREHFERELAHLALTGVRLDIERAPLHPAGVEITAIEVAR